MSRSLARESKISPGASPRRPIERAMLVARAVFIENSSSMMWIVPYFVRSQCGSTCSRRSTKCSGSMPRYDRR
ncbi:MAG: hypothetical protein M3N07_02290 [Pseudomonadota bacterium]|nr:hypothetical protein [Pseudomonadota bacterium]